MEPKAFCAQSRVLIVAGKGGVGKTTVSAAIARMAASAGLRTLIVEVEAKSGLGRLFAYPNPLTYHEAVLFPAEAGAGRPGANHTSSDASSARSGDRGQVRARTLTPDDALVEYLEEHGMRRISKRLRTSGTLDVVATAVPGIKDILVLGKVKQLERAAAGGRQGAADLIVVDAPAAGHAVQFLASAKGLLDAVVVGPVRHQAADVVELLEDPARCQVLLVTLPEETPVNEVVDTGFHLEDQAGVQLAPVVVNGLYPVVDLDEDPADVAEAIGARLTSEETAGLRRAATFRRHRQELQAEQVRRLAEALPLPQLHLPYLFTTEFGPGEVDILARAFGDAVRGLAPALP